MSSESVPPTREPVKGRDYSTVLRDLRALGVLDEVSRIAREEQQPLPAVLGVSTSRDVCRARRRIWLWLHDCRRVRADQIAAIWGVAESTVWHGLARVAPARSATWRIGRLDALGARADAEAVCAELGVSLEELMSASKRALVVMARRRVWSRLLAAGRKPGRIAAAWGMNRTAVCAARDERRAA